MVRGPKVVNMGGTSFLCIDCGKSQYPQCNLIQVTFTEAGKRVRADDRMMGLMERELFLPYNSATFSTSSDRIQAGPPASSQTN